MTITENHIGQQTGAPEVHLTSAEEREFQRIQAEAAAVSLYGKFTQALNGSDAFISARRSQVAKFADRKDSEFEIDHDNHVNVVFRNPRSGGDVRVIKATSGGNIDLSIFTGTGHIHIRTLSEEADKPNIETSLPRISYAAVGLGEVYGVDAIPPVKTELKKFAGNKKYIR